jgi:glycosyltransferase involved in cell wall biosynthesis
MKPERRRLAIIVSHPIQYYGPLHRRLAARSELRVKAFFTWHAGDTPVLDPGFGVPVTWDIPLTEGYEYEAVPNTARNPGTDHFFGLVNPSLVTRVLAWAPDIAIVHGWAWSSHLSALRALPRRGVCTLLHGDSHLLDAGRHGPRWWLKKAALRRVFRWPDGFLVTGSANKAYYRAFSVDERRLYPCPHSIDVARFARPAEAFEREAARWRRELGLRRWHRVVLFAGKFEPKKKPIELMKAALHLGEPDVVVVMVGSGELQQAVEHVAATKPDRFRVLPFQNQSRMPIVYRLADLFVLPSGYNETWGLAVNEAMACGRPVLVSDRVGCAADVVDQSCGRVFSWSEPGAMERALKDLLGDRRRLSAMGLAAAERAWLFDTGRTENLLVAAISGVLGR